VVNGLHVFAGASTCICKEHLNGTEEYVGAIVLYVDGQEIEVTDIRPQTNTGRKLVKTMNRTGRAKGYSKGIAEHSLQITVVSRKTSRSLTGMKWSARN
jgi:hypothetical protein